MAALTTTCESKTYKGVSLLAVRYFRSLTVIARNVGGYEITEEDEVPGKGQTFTVDVSSTEAYNLMQEVFEAQNG